MCVQDGVGCLVCFRLVPAGTGGALSKSHSNENQVNLHENPTGGQGNVIMLVVNVFY